ncbi:MAG: hypothetical protein AAF810_23735 [Cyanobacteria bacterium P01_D01_bin.36]
MILLKPNAVREFWAALNILQSFGDDHGIKIILRQKEAVQKARGDGNYASFNVPNPEYYADINVNDPSLQIDFYRDETKITDLNTVESCKDRSYMLIEAIHEIGAFETARFLQNNDHASAEKIIESIYGDNFRSTYFFKKSPLAIMHESVSLSRLVDYYVLIGPELFDFSKKGLLKR